MLENLVRFKYNVYRKTVIIFILAFLCLSNTLSNTCAEDNSKFRFAVMGCMHLGFCDLEDYELAVEKIKEYKPDFVLFLGGMIDAMGERPIKSLWHEFDRITNKLGVPVYNVLSGCQLMPFIISKGRSALMEKYFLDKYKERHYSFEYKNSLFIGLDSTYLFTQKRIGLGAGEEVNFLNKTLTDASKYNNIFIFLHRSPWLQDEHNDWQRIVHPLIKDKVKFVFGANIHYLDATKVDGVTYITSGVAPCYPRKFFPKPSFFHFLITDVDKNKVDIKIVPVKPFSIENLGGSWKNKELSFSMADSASKQHNTIKPYLLTAQEREVFLKPARIIEILKIKPGMNILDIGAGTGFFTFHFADTLKGTGRVYATDIDPGMVDYTENKTEENKYKNVFPVCVKPQTIDPFYKQHSFDIIFMSEAYQNLRHPEDYFRELKPSLRKKEGCLYIIHPKNVSGFSEIEFSNFKNVIKVLVSEGENYPVFQKLRKETQNFIRNWQGEDVPSKISMNIIQDFNKILLDRLFFYNLMDYYAAKGIAAGEGEWSAPLMFITYSADLKLAKWLFVQLDRDGIFNNMAKKLTDIDKEQLSRLNRILLTRTFEINKLTDLQGETGPPIYVEKSSIILTMKSAGYRFIREYDFLTHHYLLEFKRKK